MLCLPPPVPGVSPVPVAAAISPVAAAPWAATAVSLLGLVAPVVAFSTVAARAAAGLPGAEWQEWRARVRMVPHDRAAWSDHRIQEILR